MNFLDEARIHVRAGRGGKGCIAFRREKFVAQGGPAGGDGGHGGSVFLRGDSGLNTLYHLRVRSLHSAEHGRQGGGSNKTGRSGSDLEIPVPLGTVVHSYPESNPIGEVLEHRQLLTVAAGGRGGQGNARFATATNQAPRRAGPGLPGEERELRLELKLLADVGVIGLPNAGKSTFISTVSAARPKVADYPFTTLVPNLGVIADRLDVRPVVIADLPGLIQGAASGAGLGTRFLRHVDRCRILLHFVDLSVGEAGAAEELEVIEKELGEYRAELLDRTRWVVGTKLDAALEERSRDLAAAASARGLRYLEISSATRTGTTELVRALQGELESGSE